MKSSKPYHLKLIDTEDGSGDCIVELPDKLLEELGWSIGDTIEIAATKDHVSLTLAKNSSGE